ncbi:hypothetical protein ABRP18_018660 (plasmid) [Microbacterium sp. WHRI 7836]|uniref:hypothetical protein n=1 Tax=Microbacterium sp. WHRI 7836 TaxID=3162563 RepID=UPI0032ECAAD5
MRTIETVLSLLRKKFFCEKLLGGDHLPVVSDSHPDIRRDVPIDGSVHCQLRTKRKKRVPQGDIERIVELVRNDENCGSSIGVDAHPREMPDRTVGESVILRSGPSERRDVCEEPLNQERELKV